MAPGALLPPPRPEPHNGPRGSRLVRNELKGLRGRRAVRTGPPRVTRAPHATCFLCCGCRPWLVLPVDGDQERRAAVREPRRGRGLRLPQEGRGPRQPVPAAASPAPHGPRAPGPGMSHAGHVPRGLCAQPKPVFPAGATFPHTEARCQAWPPAVTAAWLSQACCARWGRLSSSPQALTQRPPPCCPRGVASELP